MSDEPDIYGFLECATCGAKAGSPDLCAGCVANRTAIHRAAALTSVLRDALEERGLSWLAQLAPDRIHGYGIRSAALARFNALTTGPARIALATQLEADGFITPADLEDNIINPPTEHDE